MIYRSAIIICYFKDITKNAMLKVVECTIDLIYGFIIVDEFLKMIQGTLKKHLDVVFMD